jgi:hypothetical protein
MKPTIKKTEEKPKREFEIEARFRSGVISGTVFSNEITTEKYGKQKMFSWNIQRSYKDGDEWKHTSSYGKKDLMSVYAVLHRIIDFLSINEDEETKE